jgi:antiviral helicase SKI2
LELSSRRCAWQINSTNELVLTELILENTFASYTPEEVAALLSAFVFQEKTEAEPELSTRLQAGRDELAKIADRVGKIQDAHKVVAAEFTSRLKFGLMEVVYEWANGMVHFFSPFPRLVLNSLSTDYSRLLSR